MNTYAPQVVTSHYTKDSYKDKDRWISYWYQLAFVRKADPSSLLEIGPGNGSVTDALRKEGIMVTTCDIAHDTHPDVVGSVTALPFPDVTFDTVLAAEVLEHIRYEDVPRALSELHRVSRNHVIISLPDPGYVFSFSTKLPLMRRLSFLLKIPFFWETHQFNGQHYWELGKRAYSTRAFVQLAKNAGLFLRESRSYVDDPAHRFFLFEIK